MSSIRRVALLYVLGSALFFAGCGDKNPAGKSAPTVEAPPAMMDLVPEGTVAVVYAPNLKGLEDGIRRIVTEVDPSQADAVKIGDATMMFGVETADMDLSRGAAVAVMAPKDAMPRFTAIVPVKDENAVAGKVKASGATAETTKGFAAITPSGPYKRAGMPASLAGPLPAGDIVARIDIATLGKTFGPMLYAQAEGALSELPGGTGASTPGAAAKPMLDGLKALVDASSVWDLAARINGTSVETELAMSFTDKTKTPVGMFVKSDLAALARGIPGDGMMTMAMSVDASQMWSAFSGLITSALEMYPPAQREILTKSIEPMRKGAGNLGPGMVMNASFTANGLEAACLLQSKDPAAYIKVMKESMAAIKDSEGSPIKSVTSEDRTVDGAKVATFRIQFDEAKLAEMAKARGGDEKTGQMIVALYGKDGVMSHTVDLGDRVLFVVGSDDALKRGLGSAKAGSSGAANPLSKALSEAGPDTVGYFRADMRAMMNRMGPAMGLNSQPGEPVLITGIANAEPGRFRARLGVDAGKYAKMIKEMMKPR